jgi:isocitrate dehydrogenase
MYWAQALAAQSEDAELKAHFAPLAKALESNEKKIVEELNAVQGKPADIGGYYVSVPAKAGSVMRPSATLNAVIDPLAA